MATKYKPFHEYPWGGNLNGRHALLAIAQPWKLGKAGYKLVNFDYTVFNSSVISIIKDEGYLAKLFKFKEDDPYLVGDATKQNPLGIDTDVVTKDFVRKRFLNITELGDYNLTTLPISGSQFSIGYPASPSLPIMHMHFNNNNSVTAIVPVSNGEDLRWVYGHLTITNTFNTNRYQHTDNAYYPPDARVDGFKGSRVINHIYGGNQETLLARAASGAKGELLNTEHHRIFLILKNSTMNARSHEMFILQNNDGTYLKQLVSPEDVNGFMSASFEDTLGGGVTGTKSTGLKLWTRATKPRATNDSGYYLRLRQPYISSEGIMRLRDITDYNVRFLGKNYPMVDGKYLHLMNILTSIKSGENPLVKNRGLIGLVEHPLIRYDYSISDSRYTHWTTYTDPSGRSFILVNYSESIRLYNVNTGKYYGNSWVNASALFEIFDKGKYIEYIPRKDNAFSYVYFDEVKESGVVVNAGTNSGLNTDVVSLPFGRTAPPTGTHGNFSFYSLSDDTNTSLTKMELIIYSYINDTNNRHLTTVIAKGVMPVTTTVTMGESYNQLSTANILNDCLHYYHSNWTTYVSGGYLLRKSDKITEEYYDTTGAKYNGYSFNTKRIPLTKTPEVIKEVFFNVASYIVKSGTLFNNFTSKNIEVKSLFYKNIIAMNYDWILGTETEMILEEMTCVQNHQIPSVTFDDAVIKRKLFLGGVRDWVLNILKPDMTTMDGFHIYFTPFFDNSGIAGTLCYRGGGKLGQREFYGHVLVKHDVNKAGYYFAITADSIIHESHQTDGKSTVANPYTLIERKPISAPLRAVFIHEVSTNTLMVRSMIEPEARPSRLGDQASIRIGTGATAKYHPLIGRANDNVGRTLYIDKERGLGSWDFSRMYGICHGFKSSQLTGPDQNGAYTISDKLSEGYVILTAPYQSDSWAVVISEDIPCFMAGRDMVLKQAIYDLKELFPDQNILDKTFYMFAELRAGFMEVRITLQPMVDTVDRVLIAVITTDKYRISNINAEPILRLAEYRLSTTRRGSAIPVSGSGADGETERFTLWE